MMLRYLATATFNRFDAIGFFAFGVLSERGTDWWWLVAFVLIWVTVSAGLEWWAGARP